MLAAGYLNLWVADFDRSSERGHGLMSSGLEAVFFLDNEAPVIIAEDI